MKVTMIPVIVGILRTIPKSLEKKGEEQEIREQVES